jgi:hypothetical protein
MFILPLDNLEYVIFMWKRADELFAMETDLSEEDIVSTFRV